MHITFVLLANKPQLVLNPVGNPNHIPEIVLSSGDVAFGTLNFESLQLV